MTPGHERIIERLIEDGWHCSGTKPGGEYWEKASVRKILFVPTDRTFADYELRASEAALESGLWEMQHVEVPG
jgi:hypothetical protein